ncbi:MAG: hypothetical protein VYB54_07580 [Pseudomonadota bacterium]|nr:hypothetical protein [Pseudomonadota bacterium]
MHHDGVPDFTGLKLTQDARTAARWPAIRYVRSEDQPGLSLNPTLIHRGQNSGYQLLNAAVHLGARRIILLGFDMRLGPNGEVHWHGLHGGDLDNPRSPSTTARWVRQFAATVPDLARAGVEVLNATPGSAIDCFPRVGLTEALARE